MAANFVIEKYDFIAAMQHMLCVIVISTLRLKFTLHSDR